MAEELLSAGEQGAAGLKIRQDGEVLHIALNRPERRNAMTGRTWTTLAHVGQHLPDAVRIVVITGEGPSFSSGIDLAMFSSEGVPGEESLMANVGPGADQRAALDAGIAAYQEGFTWLRRNDIVSIAAVRGHAIGAGFQLALSCDLRVLADDAVLCMKEPALGLVPDLTGTKPLVDIVGVPRALELCLTARTVAADEAGRLGLAELVVPGAELDTAVGDLTAALLAVDRDAAQATKDLLTAAPARTLDEQRAAERAAQSDRLNAIAQSG
ncbi:enoyl-CoA hydratase/isomerase family protein [Nocardiopsis coralliicola]